MIKSADKAVDALRRMRVGMRADNTLSRKQKCLVFSIKGQRLIKGMKINQYGIINLFALLVWVKTKCQCQIMIRKSFTRLDLERRK